MVLNIVIRKLIFFFSNITLIARNIVILKQYINEIAICKKSHRSQF